jgi:hypothetical protein
MTRSKLWNSRSGCEKVIVQFEFNYKRRKRAETPVTTNKMGYVFEQVTETSGQNWECKDCHQQIKDSELVAYHLVEGILYGWCGICFDSRRSNSRSTETLAA